MVFGRCNNTGERTKLNERRAFGERLRKAGIECSNSVESNPV
jgi:hypothetical protein